MADYSDHTVKQENDSHSTIEKTNSDFSKDKYLFHIDKMFSEEHLQQDSQSHSGAIPEPCKFQENLLATLSKILPPPHGSAGSSDNESGPSLKRKCEYNNGEGFFDKLFLQHGYLHNMEQRSLPEILNTPNMANWNTPKPSFSHRNASNGEYDNSDNNSPFGSSCHTTLQGSSASNIRQRQFYQVKWSNHIPRLVSFISTLENDVTTSDVTIATKEGEKLYAHRIVLASASNFFKQTFLNVPMDQHVVLVVAKPARYMRYILTFCYKGMVTVLPEDFTGVLEIGEELEIKGLHAANAIEVQKDSSREKDNFPPVFGWPRQSQMSKFQGFSPHTPPRKILPKSISYTTDNTPLEIQDVKKSSSTSSVPRSLSSDHSGYSESCQLTLPTLPSQVNNGSRVLLWKFLLELLHDRKFLFYIRWLDRKQGVFRILESDKIAQLWGNVRKNDNMTYEKMSRGMRTYYKRGILSHLDGTKLIYRFNLETSVVIHQLKFYEPFQNRLRQKSPTKHEAAYKEEHPKLEELPHVSQSQTTTSLAITNIKPN